MEWLMGRSIDHTISHYPSAISHSRARASAGPLEIGAAVAHGRLPQLRARLSAAPRRGQAPLLFPQLPHRHQVVDAAVGRHLTVVGAVEHEELAHLVQ